MINAAELRIGNWIYHKERLGNIQVCSVQDDEINFKINPPKLEFIPLNEEWLLRFGFKKSSNEYEKQFYLGAISFELSTLQCSLCAGEYVEGNACELEIKYVHQLQNLYFALTGQEI